MLRHPGGYALANITTRAPCKRILGTKHSANVALQVPGFLEDLISVPCCQICRAAISCLGLSLTRAPTDFMFSVCQVGP
jgi:hypothetical protein